MLPLRVRVDLGVMVMKGYFAFSCITGASLSDGLVSYAGQLFRESYPSSEKQSFYCTAPAYWGTKIVDSEAILLSIAANPVCNMQRVSGKLVILIFSLEGHFHDLDKRISRGRIVFHVIEIL